MSSDKKVLRKVQAAAAAALQKGPVKHQKVRMVLAGFCGRHVFQGSWSR
jgi:hypothetical protein